MRVMLAMMMAMTVTIIHKWKKDDDDYHPREAAHSGGERVRVEEGWREKLFLC